MLSTLILVDSTLCMDMDGLARLFYTEQLLQNSGQKKKIVLVVASLGNPSLFPTLI